MTAPRTSHRRRFYSGRAGPGLTYAPVTPNAPEYWLKSGTQNSLVHDAALSQWNNSGTIGSNSFVSGTGAPQIVNPSAGGLVAVKYRQTGFNYFTDSSNFSPVVQDISFSIVFTIPVTAAGAMSICGKTTDTGPAYEWGLAYSAVTGQIILTGWQTAGATHGALASSQTFAPGDTVAVAVTWDYNAKMSMWCNGGGENKLQVFSGGLSNTNSNMVFGQRGDLTQYATGFILHEFVLYSSLKNLAWVGGELSYYANRFALTRITDPT